MIDFIQTMLFVALIPFGIPMAAIITGHQRKMARLRLEQSGLNSVAEEQMRAMEDRLRVLERIVTDRGFDVAARIEELRMDAVRTDRVVTP